MKKKHFCFFTSLLVGVSFSTAWAQETVGFSEPENIQHLLDYRFPDWGYSSFWLDLDHRGSFIDSKGSLDIKQRRSGHDISIAPQYTLFRESEARILNFVTSIDLNYEKSENRIGNNFDESKNADNIVDIGINTEGSLKEYLSGNFFLLGGGNLSFGYVRDYDETTNNETINETTDIRRRFRTHPRLGFGVGRIKRDAHPFRR